MGILEGQVALVSGAGRGFGRAIAERLAKEGAKVALLSRSLDQLGQVADTIGANGGEAVVDRLRRDRSVPRSNARSPGPRVELGPLDILVNNAGVPGPFGPIWVVDPEEWWDAQKVHIRAPMLFLSAALPSMVERGKGRVVCISAIASRMVAANLSAYCTGKIAQNRIVAEAAAELAGTGVSVFAIDPGFAATQLARDTAADPAAQKYFSGLVDRINSHPHAFGTDPDLDRCAQRVLDLVSGKYDALSGNYYELPDDLDIELKKKEDAQ